MFRGRVKRLHLVGIGGSGMSGIAEVLTTMGYAVSGSDRSAGEATKRLRALGAAVHHGHAADQVVGSDVVVVSSAIAADNPEVREAIRRKIPVICRADMLAELMRLKYGIAVAGSHGKTTTTSLIACALERGGFDPTHVVGGRLRALGVGARLGRGEYLVAEADESDGSFLRLAPTIAVITNIDPEHLDYWRGGIAALTEAFAAFADKVPFYGAVVACADHPTVRALVPRLGRRTVTYGLEPGADWQASDLAADAGSMTFQVDHLGVRQGRCRVGLIGRHNVLNALAALAVADEVGVPFAVAAEALADFAGLARRFEVKGEARGVLVVDDYGHHPVEIAATLEAAASAFARPLVVAFQPHRYSRTAELADAFAGAFGRSDRLMVLDHYAAGEAPRPGVDSALLVQKIAAGGHPSVRLAGALAGSVDAIVDALMPGDLFVTLGAGDVHLLGERVLAALAARL